MDHLFPMIKQVYPDGRGLFLNDSAPIQGSANGLMRRTRMQILDSGLHTQLPTYESAFHLHASALQHSQSECLLEEQWSIPSVWFQTFV